MADEMAAVSCVHCEATWLSPLVAREEREDWRLEQDSCTTDSCAWQEEKEAEFIREGVSTV